MAHICGFHFISIGEGKSRLLNKNKYIFLKNRLKQVNIRVTRPVPVCHKDLATTLLCVLRLLAGHQTL